MPKQIVNVTQSNDMRNFAQKFNCFRDTLENSTQTLCKPYFKRIRDISPRDIFNVITTQVIDTKGLSYNEALLAHYFAKNDIYKIEQLRSLLNTTKIPSKIANEPNVLITKEAFIKKRTLMGVELFEKLTETMLNTFYTLINNADKPRIIAVDGSTLSFLKTTKINFKVKDDSYSSASLSCLYDTTNNMPINYLLSNDNERDALYSQLKFIKNNDIIVADRGYYSKDFLENLTKNSVKFVCRIKKDAECVITHAEALNRGVSVPFDMMVNDTLVKLKLLKYKQYPETSSNALADIDDRCSKITKDKLEKNKCDQVVLECKVQRNDLKKAYIILKAKTATLKLIKTPDNDTKTTIQENMLELTQNVELSKDLLKRQQEHKAAASRLNKNIERYVAEDDFNYYILTNTDKTDADLKKIYKDRWEVETHFRFLKTLTNINRMNSKSTEFIQQNLYVTHLSMIINSFVEKLLEPFHNTKKYTVNKTVLSTYIKTRIFDELFLKSSSDDFFDDIAKEILEIIILLIREIKPPDRFYTRKNARPDDKKFPKQTNVT